MSNVLELAIKDQVTQLVVELVENTAVLKELERSFPYLAGDYYYARKLQVTARIDDIEAILLRTQSGYVKEVAPVEQFLVTRR